MNKIREFYDDQEDVGIRSLALTVDGKRLAAGNSAGTCFIWETPGSTAEFTPMQELEAHHDQYILKCRFSPDAQLLSTCSSDRSAKIWKVEKVETEDDDGEDQIVDLY